MLIMKMVSFLQLLPIWLAAAADVEVVRLVL